MFGNNGADKFVFADGDFGGTTAVTADRITDFNRTQGDIIDLSPVDARTGTGANDALAFIGSAAFSDTAGERRYHQTATTTGIYGDTNGDGVADFMIRLNGSISLTPEAFVL